MSQPQQTTISRFGWLLGGLLLGAAVSVGATFALQQPSADIPRLSNGKPDFSGIWQTTSAADADLEPHHHRADAPPGPGVVEGGAIPYLPEALEQRAQNFANRFTADPARKGFTLGVPRGIYYPAPFQILQRERDFTLLPQFGHSVRTIHTNNTDHPLEPNDWWLGDSRARWDGDTLVVSVKHFNDETWLDSSGNFHSDALQVEERWRLLDANTIEYKATLSDINVYSRPWSLTVYLHRHREPGFQLVEDYRYTLDYGQYYPYPAERAPAAGNTTETEPAAAPTSKGDLQ
ncbi:hypothetical protein [Rheinheimera texasensis]|uniref:hypothetical protein n=1 Tax=Rheinheimera texasensis TaxID=306205 RepID=UPI0032B122D6